MQRQETLVQILPNAFIKMRFVHFLCQQCCYMNTEHVTNGFAWTFKSYRQKPALQLKTQPLFISRSIPSPKSSKRRLADTLKCIHINNKNNFLCCFKCFPYSYGTFSFLHATA